MMPTPSKLDTFSNYVPKSLQKTFARFYYNILGLSSFGFNYRCNICLSGLSHYTPLGRLCNGKFIRDLNINGSLVAVSQFETLSLDHYLCPVCGSDDKARLYSLWLDRQLTRYNHPLSLLHFAPEAGLRTFLKTDKRIHYRTADLNRTDVDDNVDIRDLTLYNDCSFDSFICSHVLEHVDDDIASVNQLFRILKPGGWGIIMVPILLSLTTTYSDPSISTEVERSEHFGLEDHLRVYSKSDFLSLLKAPGFEVHQFSRNYFGEKAFRLNGLSPNSVLYVVIKR